MRTILLFLSLLPATIFAQETYHGDGPDDVLRFVPLAATYALKACGVETESSWQRLLVCTVTSCALSTGTTWALKQSIHERRPDYTDRHSFPSGHTTMAFTGATILYKELHHTHPWIVVAGYAVATGVAIDRVARNRHHWQDVAAGAAIGVGGTVLGYWIGDQIIGKQTRCQVAVGTQELSCVVKL